jgi:methionyl-tRNA formyltransferase
MNEPSLLFVSKNRKDVFAEEAIAYIAQHFPIHHVVLGSQGEEMPEVLLNCDVDYIVSYLCPWILPASVLNKAKIAAINFHPGPPAYPGVGCYNFAIYDRAPIYGVTCHHMAPEVDTGKIIDVRRFPVFASDTVLSIARQSSAQMLVLFYEVISCILNGGPLPASRETWQRKPYTSSKMYKLFEIKPEMSEAEVERRIKSADFPGWPGAFIEVGGRRFYQNPPPPKR